MRGLGSAAAAAALPLLVLLLAAEDGAARRALGNAVARGDADGIEAAARALPFDAYAHLSVARTAAEAAGGDARAREAVEAGLSRRPRSPDLLLLAAQDEEARGRDAEASALLLAAARTASYSAEFARTAAAGRLDAARRHAAAAALAEARAAAGGGPEAAALAQEERRAAEDALESVVALAGAVDPDAIDAATLAPVAAEAKALLADLRRRP